MNGNLPSEILPELRAMANLVRRTGQILRASIIVTGLGRATGLTLCLLAAAALIDLGMPLPPPGRFLALLVAVLPALAILLFGVVRPLFRRLTPARMARRMEVFIPRIHNRLVTCMDLLYGGAERFLSTSFSRRLVSEAAQRVRTFKPGAVVDRYALRQAGLLALAGLALFALLFFRFPGQFPVVLARILLPWADIPPAAEVAFTVAPGTVPVLRGDDIPFAVQVTRGKLAEMRLEIRGAAGGRALWYDLAPQSNQVWLFTLQGFEHSFSYRVHGGGTWSKLHRITLLDRPSIVDLHTVLHYPEYMGAMEPQAGPEQTAEVSGPLAGKIEVVVRINGPAATGVVQLLQIEQPRTSRNATAETVIVTASFPLQDTGSNTWSGRFPLERDGFYRVQLRNVLGHANPPMKPARITVIPDLPPQVVLERPASDLTLSRAAKLPLVISAYDDFALADLSFGLQFGATTGYVWNTRPITNYAVPRRNDATVMLLDLAGMNLKIGEQFRYRVTARDRKGQVAQTRDYAVRIAADDKAEDRRLARFEAEQDAFVQRLMELAAAQARIDRQLDALSMQYAPLLVRLDAAVDRLQANPDATLPFSDAAVATNLALARQVLQTLDAADTNLLDSLRKDLAQLVAAQQTNLLNATRFSSDFLKASEESASLPLVPAQFAAQMQEMQQAFNALAAAPMQAMAAAMQQGAMAGQMPPNLNAMQQAGDALQNDLNSMPDQFAALADAAHALQSNNPAIASRLAAELTRMRAGRTAKDLAELRDFLAALKKEMQRAQEREQHLLDRTTEAATTNELAQLAAQQTNLANRIDPLLADTRQLQDNPTIKKMKRRPAFPGEPYTPESDEYQVPPAEEDTPEPDAKDKQEAAAKGDTSKTGESKDDEEEDPLYMPALGGPRPVLDPRFADSLRPVPQKAPADPNARAQAEDLASHEWQRVQELNMAQQSVGTDQQSLDQMLQQLDQQRSQGASRSPPQRGSQPGSQSQGSPQSDAQSQGSPSQGAQSSQSQSQPSPSSQSRPPPSQPAQAQQPQSPRENAPAQGNQANAMRQLSEMLKSPTMQQAQAMANRMQQLRRQQSSSGSSGSASAQSTGGAAAGGVRQNPAPPAGTGPEVALDPALRTMILKMRPALREELLLGMQEEGPEGYRAFIRQYFRRLSAEKDTP